MDEQGSSQESHTPESEIALFAAPQNLTPEITEQGTGIAEQGETALGGSTATPIAVTRDGSGEPKEGDAAQDTSEEKIDMAPFTEAEEMEGVQVESSETPLAEAANLTEVGNSGLATLESTETPFDSDLTTQQEQEQYDVQVQEQPIDGLSAAQDEQSTINLPQVSQTTTPLSQISESNRQSTSTDKFTSDLYKDLFLGVEVMLLLCSFATGLAWILLRKRGG
jgi:hypothetical protein